MTLGCFMPSGRYVKDGFTLIELAVVLVIIGLIAGGIVVGRDIIKTAEARAQISQIERYQQAVNAFRGKIGYIPGDVPAKDAASFGLLDRSDPFGSYSLSPGDGKVLNTSAVPYLLSGEQLLFWRDLGDSALIEYKFIHINTPGPTLLDAYGVNGYLPAAKISPDSAVLVYSDGTYNYYNIAKVSSVESFLPAVGMSVSAAYNIDKKVDDGLPLSGRVKPQLLFPGAAQGWDYAMDQTIDQVDSAVLWANPDNINSHTSNSLAGTALPATQYTCYDNGNNAAQTMQYSVTFNNGAGMNCAVSIRFN